MLTTHALPSSFAGLGDLTPLQQAFIGFLSSYEGSTRRLYEYHLTNWLTWITEQGVDPLIAERAHLSLYVRFLSEVRQLRGSTVAGTFVTIKGFYRYCHIEGIVARDPAAYVRLPKCDYRQKAPLEREQLREIRRAGKELGGRHWALAEMLVVGALRITESISARIEDYQDVERGHRVLKFRRKGGKWATLPVPVPMLLAFDDATGERTTGPILTKLDGTPLHRTSAAGLLRVVVKRAGIPRPVNPHLVRASVITWILEEGTVREAQWLAGHADPRTTSRHYDLGRHNHDRHPIHVQSARLTA